MAKSKSKRKATKVNLKAKRNLTSIKNIQVFMKNFSFAGEMTDPRKTMLFRDFTEVSKTKATSDAFSNIRFQWTILVGVLGRTQTGELYTKQVQLTTDAKDPVLADELNDCVAANLRLIWNNFNPLHRLTGFYVCTPNDTDISNILVAQLFFKYKTPDRIVSAYEIESNNSEPIKFYCKSIWEQLFADIRWTEVSNFKPAPLQFQRLTKAERNKRDMERELEYLQEKLRNGTKIPRLFKKSSPSIIRRNSTKPFNIYRTIKSSRTKNTNFKPYKSTNC